VRSLVAAGVLAGLAGCAMNPPEREWPIKPRWAVPENASEACLSAARRASKYCLDTAVPSDIAGRYTSECTKAQWEHARTCN
jgi:hypothetical protein